MQTFKDKLGREWQIEIDYPSAKRVRDLLGLNLSQSDLLALAKDTVQIVDILYVLCKPQADQSKISDVDFAALLWDSDVIEAAIEKFMEAMVDFFPTSRKATARQALAKIREVGTKVQAALAQEMEKIDSDELVRSTMDSICGRYRTN